MENPSAVTTFLMRLRAMGIRISIDDFGTGYSSLAYLRQFPVDALKIDRSFVQGLEHGKDTAAIVASMIEMAQGLGLHVVAEGVETEGQLAVLRSLGCDAAQGYLLGEPLDVTRATAMLQAKLPQRQEPSKRSPGFLAGKWHRAQRRWTLPTTGRALLMTAAVLGVFISAGLVALVKGLNAGHTFSSVSRDRVQEPGPEGTLANIGNNDARQADANPPSTASLASSGPSVPRPTITSTTTPPVAAAPARRSFEVLHQHRLGNCRGRLLVSRDGIAFVPDDQTRGHALTLKHAEFLQTVSGNTLAIQSASKTYRFTLDAASSRGKNQPTVADIAVTIVRARPR